jgi:hypothetical protein
MAMYVNGVADGTDTSAAFPINLAMMELDIGHRQVDTVHRNGPIGQVRYYKAPANDEELEDISNGIFPSGIAGGGISRVRKANDAAEWYQRMKLKREDDEAMKLIDKYLDS